MIQPAQMLSESDGQIRRAWSDFQTLWHDVEPSWRDSRRQQWEKMVIQGTIPILSLTTNAIAELREASLRAAAELADPLRNA